MINETLQINVGTIGNYISYLPRKATDSIVEFLNNYGLNVSQRWGGLLITFLSVLLFYIGIKLSKPILKWILILLGIILLGGMLIPW